MAAGRTTEQQFGGIRLVFHRPGRILHSVSTPLHLTFLVFPENQA